MKYFPKLLFLFLILSSNSYCSEKDSTGLSVKINLIKEYFIPFHPYHYFHDYVPDNDSIKLKKFDIEITLKNNSDSTICFYLMTCSWEWDFIINNTYIYFSGKDCEGNFPYMRNIKSGDSIILKTTLQRDLRWDNPQKNSIGKGYNVKTTKIGLIYIDKKQGYDYHNIHDDKSRWKIIWSNPLYLNK